MVEHVIGFHDFVRLRSFGARKSEDRPEGGPPLVNALAGLSALTGTAQGGHDDIVAHVHLAIGRLVSRDSRGPVIWGRGKL